MKLFSAIALTVGLISTTASAETGPTDPNANIPPDNSYQAPSVNTSNDKKSDISGTPGNDSPGNSDAYVPNAGAQ